MIKELIVGAAMTVIALFVCCSQQTTQFAQEQKSEKAFGYIYKQDGTAAPGAIVTLVRSDYIPSGQGVSKKMATSITTSTDKKGKFVFDNLSAGIYNLFGFAGNGSDALYKSSISIYDSDSGKCIVNDTLRPTHILRGKIQFSPYTDSRSVLILMMGSTRMTWPQDGLGNFTFTNLAEGTYQIRFLPTNPAYSIFDTSFKVPYVDTFDIGTINLFGNQFDTLGSDTIVVRGRPSISGTWGPNKTFKIMCNVEIPQSQRLEIKEGTHIVFMGNYNFVTNGNCIVHGTVDNPVIFTYGFNYAGVGWKLGNSSVNDGYGYNDPYLKPDSLVFENCIIENCEQPYFELNAYKAEFYFEMRNCILRYLKDGIQVSFVGDDGVINTFGKRIVIRNCVFHDMQLENIQCGIDFLHKGSISCKHDTIVQVTNNIFFHEQWNAAFKCYFPHNCYDSTPFTSDADPTCVFADPQFVNFQKGDYHLIPASPCRGAGLNGEDMGLKFDK